MNLSRLLGIQAGDRAAVVGCGGKTSLVKRLAAENAAAMPRGVLIAPTTQMGLSELETMKGAKGITLLGRERGEKLLAAELSDIREQADRFSLTLMEADGSRGLPLKGWAAHEPVVPDFTSLTLGVVSAKAAGLPATAAYVHRLALFLEQSGLREGNVATAKVIARMIAGCLARHGIGRQAVLVNQAEDAASLESARQIAKALREQEAWKGLILLGALKEDKPWTAV